LRALTAIATKRSLRFRSRSWSDIGIPPRVQELNVYSRQKVAFSICQSGRPQSSQLADFGGRGMSFNICARQLGDVDRDPTRMVTRQSAHL
jgi:hypothetical protein